MKLNVKKVLAKAEHEKKRVKPLPKVRVRRSIVNDQLSMINDKPTHRSPVLKRILAETPPEVKQKVKAYGDAVMEKDRLLKDLWTEMGQLKRERGKLSSSIAWKVVEIDTRLAKESPALANELMKGNMPDGELKDLAEQIQSFTDRMASVWDKIRHVEQYGELPAHVEEKVELQLDETSVDVAALHHEIRRLDDLIYKCNKKLVNNNRGIKATKNSSKVHEWKEKIALAEARRDELKLKKKKLEYEAREQRAGAQ